MNDNNFTAATAPGIKAGDKVLIDPVWNRTHKDERMHFPDIVVVQKATKWKYCQTGVLLHVINNDGETRELSAGWFRPIEETP